MADADEVSAEQAAVSMRKCITDVITEVVHSLGGCSDNENNALCDDKVPYEVFGHKLKPLRLPKHCPAADMPPSELMVSVQDLHNDLRAAANAPGREALLQKLRVALTPRRADKAPIAIAPLGAAAKVRANE